MPKRQASDPVLFRSVEPLYQAIRAVLESARAGAYRAINTATHQDIGQMDSYVRMFDAHARPTGDDPTIGLILCSKKNQAIAKYSVLSEARQIFAAKYVEVLPTEQELTREIERERRLIDARQVDKMQR